MFHFKLVALMDCGCEPNEAQSSVFEVHRRHSSFIILCLKQVFLRTRPIEGNVKKCSIQNIYRPFLCFNFVFQTFELWILTIFFPFSLLLRWSRIAEKNARATSSTVVKFFQQNFLQAIVFLNCFLIISPILLALLDGVIRANAVCHPSSVKRLLSGSIEHIKFGE